MIPRGACCASWCIRLLPSLFTHRLHPPSHPSHPASHGPPPLAHHLRASQLEVGLLLKVPHPLGLDRALLFLVLQPSSRQRGLVHPVGRHCQRLALQSEEGTPVAGSAWPPSAQRMQSRPPRYTPCCVDMWEARTILLLAVAPAALRGRATLSIPGTRNACRGVTELHTDAGLLLSAMPGVRPVAGVTGRCRGCCAEWAPLSAGSCCCCCCSSTGW